MDIAMAALSPPSTITKVHAIQVRKQKFRLASRRLRLRTFTSIHRNKQLCVSCIKLPSWEEASSVTYENAESANDVSIFESIIQRDPDKAALAEDKDTVADGKNQPLVQSQLLKWPMWLLGPSVLLATGVIPTLWLPLSSVFLGPNIAGLLSLVGLDCIFNMGASLFLLMADACARPKNSTGSSNSEVPFSYKFWNISASLLGFILPLLMILASHRGLFKPHLPFISFTVLLGPYLLLLSVQCLTEMLTWHWKSPVWLVTPIVYEAYRVLQLMRGIRLGGEIGAPAWAVESIKVLVSLWVLVLGMQLMRVAWFAGSTWRSQQTES